MKFFITGGAGFIGAAVTERLLADGHHVVIYDNLRRNSIKDRGLMGHPSLSMVKGDIMDVDQLYDAMRDADAVVHLAAIAGVDTVVNQPLLCMDVNLIGTYNVLQAMRRRGSSTFRKVMFFSTSEVYGPHTFRADEGDMTTQGPIGEPRWVYAMSKLSGEFLVEAFSRETGVPYVSIRPFNVYGPGQIGEGAIHNFIVRALEGKNVIVHNDGDQIRSWTYIDDMVDAVVAALLTEGADNNILNIGNAQATCTTLALAENIIAAAQSSSQIEFKQIDYPDVEVRVPSTKRAQRLLGFTPKVGLDEGIRRAVAWYRDLGQRGN